MRFVLLIITTLFLASPAAAQQGGEPNARPFGDIFPEPGVTTTPGEVIADRVDDVLGNEPEGLVPLDLIGGWDLDFLGGTCQLFFTLTRVGEDEWFRAATRDCEHEVLRGIDGWALEENTLIFVDAGRAAIAILTPQPEEPRFQGRIIASNLPIAVERGTEELVARADDALGGDGLTEMLREDIEQLNRTLEYLEGLLAAADPFPAAIYGACSEDLSAIDGEIVGMPVPIDRIVPIVDGELYVVLVAGAVVTVRALGTEVRFDFILRDFDILAERAAAGTAWFVLERYEDTRGPGAFVASAYSLGEGGCQWTHLAFYDGTWANLARTLLPAAVWQDVEEARRVLELP